jgi:hypothetical protein
MALTETEPLLPEDPLGYSLWFSIRSVSVQAASAHPYVTVYINGQKIDSTPTADSSKPKWDHDFHIELKEFPATITLKVNNTVFFVIHSGLAKETLELDMDMRKKIIDSIEPVIVHDGPMHLKQIPEEEEESTATLDATIVVAALSKVAPEHLNWDYITNLTKIHKDEVMEKELQHYHGAFQRPKSSGMPEQVTGTTTQRNAAWGCAPLPQPAVDRLQEELEKEAAT